MFCRGLVPCARHYSSTLPMAEPPPKSLFVIFGVLWGVAIGPFLVYNSWFLRNSFFSN